MHAAPTVRVTAVPAAAGAGAGLPAPLLPQPPTGPSATPAAPGAVVIPVVPGAGRGSPLTAGNGSAAALATSGLPAAPGLGGTGNASAAGGNASAAGNLSVIEGVSLEVPEPPNATVVALVAEILGAVPPNVSVNGVPPVEASAGEQAPVSGVGGGGGGFHIATLAGLAGVDMQQLAVVHTRLNSRGACQACTAESGVADGWRQLLLSAVGGAATRPSLALLPPSL